VAAADFAEGYTDEDGNKLPPPPELVLAWQVEQWGATAIFGSHEIPVRLLRRMSNALNVYKAFSSYTAGSNNAAEWARSHPVYLDVVRHIRELRKNA